jgi:hypothetical protein
LHGGNAMKQPKSLPTALPFLSVYTPTFRRPQALARNMASMGRQTAVDDSEQVVIPDHSGFGVAGGMYGRVPWYAAACRGRYVAFVPDDDYLAAENVVAKVKAFAEKMNYPDVIIVKAIKNGFEVPYFPLAEPKPSEVDICNYILSRSVWRAHAGDYGLRYEGDADHALVVYRAGYRREFLPIVFAEGGAANGRPEVDW